MQIALPFIRLIFKPFIHLWLIAYGVKNYTINKDNTVDVDGDVNLSFLKVFFIPIKFNQINGNFYLFCSFLISLRGCPKTVKGDFNCSDNKINSLVGSPCFIGGSYVLSNNSNLKSLYGCTKFIGKDLVAIQCNIETLEHSPLEVGRDILISENPIMYLEGFQSVFSGKFYFFSKEFKILEAEHFYINEYTLEFSYADMNSIKIQNSLDVQLNLKDEKKEIRKVKI